MHIYEMGGNAVDAAIAANAVQGVVAPETCGIGGDLFALIVRPGNPRPAALNASGRAGSGVDAAALRAQGHSMIPPFHPFTVTVPGCVDGWVTLAERFASMPLADLLSPAIEFADKGFPVSDELAGALTRRSETLQPQAPWLYPPIPGTIVRRAALAETLRDIAQGGRAGFYEGSAGRAIRRAAPHITAPDLSAGQSEWVEPISAQVFGRTAWTMPPNTQGYLTLASSWIFEQTQPPSAPMDPDYVHLQIEAFRSVAWERDDLVTDPRRAPLAPDRLTAPDRLQDRAERIDRSHAIQWPSPNPAQGGTAYLCFVDEAGMGVSLIQSNYMGIGSGIGAAGAGFFLHNRGAGFTLHEGHPNELTPGGRPLHTLSPTIWTRDGTLDTVLGTRGGDYQPQLLLQMASAMMFAGDRPDSAQRRPRWVLSDSVVRVESRMPERLISELHRRGHNVEPTEAFERGWGPVSIIQVATDGTRIAASDPRVATSLAAVARGTDG